MLARDKVAQLKCAWTCQRNNLMQEFARKMLGSKTKAYVLHKSAQAQHTRTCQTGSFMQEFSGKMPGPKTWKITADFVRACAVEIHMDIEPKSHFMLEYRAKMPGSDGAP